jgi:N utilization substance protein B
VSAGRRSARRQAVFVLYQQDLLKLGMEAALGRVQADSLDEYATRLVRGVSSRRSEIDALLGEYLSGWNLARLGVLERAILRVAAYELLNESEVPVAVVVDEAVNLAKRFCSAEAGALVNGILGSAARAARHEESDPETPAGVG